MDQECAVYKGDDLLCSGTVEECAKVLNVSPRTILFYQYPSYQRRAKNAANRRVTIILDQEDEDE
ncbi:MAG: hypothetical protein WBA84_06770 [Carnobacterium sp.]|uniref:hypothetical protein n=1 Tax=Carnobacterium sp. TaxID=48221 RepID=UPI003C716D96